MIKFCPNCKHELSSSKHLAQGVKECPNCKGRYFQLETRKPKANESTRSANPV